MSKRLTKIDQEIIILSLEWAMLRIVDWSKHKRLTKNESELLKRLMQIELILQGREEEIEQPLPPEAEGA